MPFFVLRRGTVIKASVQQSDHSSAVCSPHTKVVFRLMPLLQNNFNTVTRLLLCRICHSHRITVKFSVPTCLPWLPRSVRRRRRSPSNPSRRREGVGVVVEKK